MDPTLFLADLERKPQVLESLAERIKRGEWDITVPADIDRVLFLGMGSSTYAASVIAARLRSVGIDAVAELASSDLLPPPDPRTLVVAVSASGGSTETLRAVSSYAARSHVIAMTNVDGSAITSGADSVIALHAEPEQGGVACRSYQHTLVGLMVLEQMLTDRPSDVAALVHSAAAASADLLDRRADWMPDVARAIAGPAGTWTVAPARRFSSAQQGALMLREGPRRSAAACETGDWSHVDVYLTKNHDYRMLLFAGSSYEEELINWTTERSATVVAVGDDVSGATMVVRFAGDQSDDVRLLTEVLVPELIAVSLWADS